MNFNNDNDIESLIRADGMIHIRRDETPKQNPDRHKTEKQMHRDATYADANICLTCTKKICSGDLRCFIERKKKLDKQK